MGRRSMGMCFNFMFLIYNFETGCRDEIADCKLIFDEI